MPVMAVADQNDARGSAQVLARTARKCIDGTLQASTHRIALNNIYRLLHAYRSHGFAGYSYASRTLRGPEALTLMPTPDRRVYLLADALERALSETYGNVPGGAVFDELDRVILVVAGNSKDELVDEQREKASRFLDRFAEHLQPSI
ncbi:hypothetical protein [Sphingomonas sp. CFBP 8765]|uniref:hypothetical protein n=1 Tax=Sphingomonas sp. CFBP 8765 TaxID=2775274 RepID=UPI0017843488|nr:hypothetical protein [Sphingomonas sp. CFBP 8765]MBD8471557.1 hypothetical protein [Sphingomonas sp. CFBP 8765]